MEKQEYIEKLEYALLDLLDGNSEWHEINQYTGLGTKRCKEIEALFLKIIKKEK